MSPVGSLDIVSIAGQVLYLSLVASASWFANVNNNGNANNNGASNTNVGLRPIFTFSGSVAIL